MKEDFRRFVSSMEMMLKEWEEYEKGKNGEKNDNKNETE